MYWRFTGRFKIYDIPALHIEDRIRIFTRRFKNLRLHIREDTDIYGRVQKNCDSLVLHIEEKTRRLPTARAEKIDESFVLLIEEKIL